MHDENPYAPQTATNLDTITHADAHWYLTRVQKYFRRMGPGALIYIVVAIIVTITMQLSKGTFRIPETAGPLVWCASLAWLFITMIAAPIGFDRAAFRFGSLVPVPALGLTRLGHSCDLKQPLTRRNVFQHVWPHRILDRLYKAREKALNHVDPTLNPFLDFFTNLWVDIDVEIASSRPVGFGARIISR